MVPTHGNRGPYLGVGVGGLSLRNNLRYHWHFGTLIWTRALWPPERYKVVSCKANRKQPKVPYPLGVHRELCRARQRPAAEACWAFYVGSPGGWVRTLKLCILWWPLCIILLRLRRSTFYYLKNRFAFLLATQSTQSQTRNQKAKPDTRQAAARLKVKRNTQMWDYPKTCQAHQVVGSFFLKTSMLTRACYDSGVNHAMEVACSLRSSGHTEVFKAARESQTIASFLPHTTPRLSLTPAGTAENPK